jgi:hypothetical protein
VSDGCSGACIGFKCELLKKAQATSDGVDEDSLSLLDLTAHLSVLGSGLADEMPKDATSNYFNSETQWRVML